MNDLFVEKGADLRTTAMLVRLGSPSFECCANKQQATEATSETCWIFLGLKQITQQTNQPTNQQTNKLRL